jgi:hypothetical protein
MPVTEGSAFTPSRIVSPGVFTRENDLSGLSQGVENIGAAIVAPFPKGPGFSPTIVRDSAELEEKFGVADGQLYGPYAAKFYLNQKSPVTICRVGGLTGYKQKYPYVIYAVKGTWQRSGSLGALTSGSSVLYPAGTYSDGYVDGINYVTASNNHPSGGYVAFKSASFTVTLGSLAADTSYNAAGTTTDSGSVLYNGQTISLGFAEVGGVMAITASRVYVSSSVQGTTTSTPNEKIYAALENGTFSGSLYTGTITFPYAAAPFTDSVLYSASFNTNTTTCGDSILNISGILTGSFGRFTGNFTANGTPEFDICNNTWTTNNADFRVLAVLADTLNGPIDENLESPGFSGSQLYYKGDYAGLVPTASNGLGHRLENNGTDVSLNFSLDLRNTLSNSTSYGSYEFSLDPSDSKFITSVFGENARIGDPDNWATGTQKDAAYRYKTFEDTINTIKTEKYSWFISGSHIPNDETSLLTTSGFAGEPMNFTDDYSLNLLDGDSAFALTNAYTPWVISQQISSMSDGDPVRYRLFRLLTLADGTSANTQYKVEISQIKLPGTVNGTEWATFTLTLRKFSDTEKRPQILEVFTNLSLDPDSPNFITKRIGDRYNYINMDGKVVEFGNYPNNSKHIRIESAINPYPKTVMPYGFEAYSTPINSAIGHWTPTMKYSKASVWNDSPGRYSSGIVFEDPDTSANEELISLYPTASTGVGVSDDNKQYFAPLPAFGTYVSKGRNIDFALDNNITDGGVGVGNYLSGSNAVPTAYDAVNEPYYVKMRKFIFGFQGGFDGQSPAIPLNVGSDIIPGNTQGLDCTNINSAGSIAYKQCVRALSNADEWDINLIVTPGITHQDHSYVTNLVVEMCEDRGDVFYIMDLYTIPEVEGTSGLITSVVNLADAYDTSYAAAYYPWIKILDKNYNKIIKVPPSVVMPGVYAASDLSGAEWFAPAGLGRGGIPDAVQVCDRTTHGERDELYEGRVNPIAVFPGTGISVWGQKTLQINASALDRINVRRLLINLKKFVSSSAKYLVFEQNVGATRNRFLAMVNPYLESVQQRYGLYAFKVVMDDSNNTPDLIDRNIMYGQLYLQPTKTSEFILIDFNIMPTGASFTNA